MAKENLGYFSRHRSDVTVPSDYEWLPTDKHNFQRILGSRALFSLHLRTNFLILLCVNISSAAPGFLLCLKISISVHVPTFSYYDILSDIAEYTQLAFSASSRRTRTYMLAFRRSIHFFLLWFWSTVLWSYDTCNGTCDITIHYASWELAHVKTQKLWKTYWCHWSTRENPFAQRSQWVCTLTAKVTNTAFLNLTVSKRCNSEYTSLLLAGFWVSYS